VQYWVKNRWWINGGVGLAMDFPALYDIDKSKDQDWNFGVAVGLSTGIELVQKKKYALDLQAKLHMASVNLENNQQREGVSFSIGIGFNWY